MPISKNNITYLKNFCAKNDGDIIRRFTQRVILRLVYPYTKIRYTPIMQYLRKNNVKDFSMLEIGSGSFGITLFMPKEIIGLDLDFQGAKIGYLKMINGDCRALPFKDGSFDYVICMDMLEHIDYQYHVKVLEEMLRVAKKVIFMGFPSGENAEVAEQKMYRIFEKKVTNWHKGKEEKNIFIRRNAFLLQHRENKLPETEKIYSALHVVLEQNHMHANISLIKNESVKVWYYLMLYRLEYDFCYIILSVLINLLPFTFFNSGWGGFYRTIFIVEKNKI